MKSYKFKRTVSDRSSESSAHWLSTSFITVIAVALLALACSAQQVHKQTNADGASPGSVAAIDADRMSALAKNLPLHILSDVPLTGGATRLDYQSLDSENGRLYIAHLGSDLMTVFDVNKQTIIGDVKDLKRVHGVLAVPELHRIYASATGSNELAIIDDSTLQVITRARAGDYPDGVAYASKSNKIYVSDLHGKTDTVIDAKTNQGVTTMALGGGAGNSQYDSVSEHIFVTVQGQNQLAEIDPNKDQVIGRYPLPGCKGSHGLNIDSEHALAFVACEENAKLAVFDLDAKKMTDRKSVV